MPLFAPWLSGERVPVFDDDARAAFVGLAIRHGLGHLLRSVMEGVAYQLRWAFDYALAYGAPVLEIRCVGGGTMSDAWLQIIADVLERPILAVRDPQDAGARGAAACVRVGLGHEPDLAFARQEAALDRTYEPSDAAKDRHDRGYDRFRELYDLTPSGLGPGREESVQQLRVDPTVRSDRDPVDGECPLAGRRRHPAPGLLDQDQRSREVPRLDASLEHRVGSRLGHEPEAPEVADRVLVVRVSQGGLDARQRLRRLDLEQARVDDARFTNGRDADTDRRPSRFHAPPPRHASQRWRRAGALMTPTWSSPSRSRARSVPNSGIPRM